MDQDLNRKINALSDEQLEALLNLILEMNEHKDEIVKLIGSQIEDLNQSLETINTVSTILELPRPPVRRMFPEVVRRMIPEITENFSRIMSFPVEMNNLKSRATEMINQLDSEIKAIRNIEASISKMLM